MRALGSVPLAAAISFATTGAFVASSLITPMTAHAQNTNATIRGTVTDPTGALVPDATVIVVNKDTGVTVFNGKTDSAGTFVAPQVIPGTYKVTVTAAGLKQYVFDNLIATVAQVAAIDLTHWRIEALINAGKGADGLAWVL